MENKSLAHFIKFGPKFSPKFSPKFFCAVLVLSTFFVGGIFLALIPVSHRFRRKLRIEFTHWTARGMLRVLGVKVLEVKVEKTQSVGTKKNNGRLIIANHTSVLDVMILAAREPTVFVTSVEIEENLFLGFLARTGGTLFVERRNRLRLGFDIAQIKEVLLEGFNVGLFPEGTSTDGSHLKPFKRGLFSAATEIGAPLETLCIQFETIGTQPITTSNHDHVFYYGDHQMGQHLIKLFTNPSVCVSIQSLGLIHTHPAIDLTQLAHESRRRIEEVYRPIVRAILA